MLILRIWKSVPGKYFCLSTKSRSGKWQDHFFRRGQFKQIKDFIKKNLDKDLYWCPHGFTKPRRLKEYAEIPKLLWADLDEADPREMKGLMPTVAWESSPGRYASVWVIDGFMTEDLNRRLTYHLEADHGGWDVTQVLRVPNTTNYKYDSKPRVRLLWSDGPSYTVHDIEKQLPTEKKTRREKNAATRIYRKYEKSLPGWVRRQLLKGKATKGKRSQVIWRLANELLEAGVSLDEAFELLRASPWNKFAGRRDGDEQLKRELTKATKKHFRVIDDESGEEDPETGDDYNDLEEEDDPPYNFLTRSMAEVEEENIDWIWYPYLARGELTILEGDPGLGKSYLAQMISAGIVDGRRLPTPKARRKPIQGKVAYFDIENASGSVTKKRLSLNGCKNMKDFFQEEEPFSVDDEDAIDRVYAAIEKLKPTLVVFDTLNTYMGGADTHKAAETQQSFKRFVDIARRFGCSVLVLRHLTKSSKERALYRGQGSIAFAGLARVVLTVGTVPHDEEESELDDVRALAVTKINVTRPPKALTFMIQGLPDTLREQDRSRFVWGEYIDLTSDQLVSAPLVPRSGGKGNVREEAEKFLTDMLNGTPVTATKIYRAGEARSLSAKLLKRVAESLGVKIEGKGRAVTWTLL